MVLARYGDDLHRAMRLTMDCSRVLPASTSEPQDEGESSCVTAREGLNYLP